MTVQTDSFCFSSLLLGRNTRCDVLGLMTDPIDCNLSYLMVSFFFSAMLLQCVTTGVQKCTCTEYIQSHSRNTASLLYT